MTITQRVCIILLFIGVATWLAAPRDYRVGAQVYRPSKPTPTPAPKPSPPVRRPVAGTSPKTKPKIVQPSTPAPKSAPSSFPTLSTFSFETVTLDEQGNEKARRRSQARYFIEDLGANVTLDMVRIPAGEFTMGSPESEADRYSDEGPQHRVKVSAFFIGRFEVTCAQWRQVARMPKVKVDLEGRCSEDSWRQPVEGVSWSGAVEFCERLQKRTGRAYRLPSEAEWEYAARAGTTTPFAFGPTITPEIVNYDGNKPYGNAPTGIARRQTVAVDSLGVANAFGLFDMHGNVYEWCQDLYHDSYKGAPTDGSAWLSGGDSSGRVLRGGGCFHNARACRSASRANNNAERSIPLDTGFRVVVSARIS